MRAVVQRVSRARVLVGGETIAQIGPGLVVLVGVDVNDVPEDARYLADKIAGLRIFEDAQGKMNRSVCDVGGSVLAISQFTLLGDCRRGRRPSFTEAAPPEVAEALYLQMAEYIQAQGVPVALGRFGAHMEVELTNDGPVTILLDSSRLF